MDKETFEVSWKLIEGVMEDVKTYLYETKEWRDKHDLLEEINDACQELYSWQDAVKKVKE